VSLPLPLGNHAPKLCHRKTRSFSCPLVAFTGVLMRRYSREERRELVLRDRKTRAIFFLGPRVLRYSCERKTQQVDIPASSRERLQREAQMRDGGEREQGSFEMAEHASRETSSGSTDGHLTHPDARSR
jgi:hypothetical protein